MAEEGFLRALEASPSDDALRLVFADWLEERSDRRAEFLRAAVALHSTPAGDENLPRLVRRLRELGPAASPAWMARACRNLAEDDIRAVVFRDLLRGGHSGAFVSVEERRDPSPYLLADLVERYPGLRLVSAAEHGVNGVFDRLTRERGWLASVHSLEWV